MSELQELPLNTFLIVLRQPVNQKGTGQVVQYIQKSHGKTLLIARDNRTLIAMLPQYAAEHLRKSSQIKHVGTIRIGQRKIVRTQVLLE